MLHVIKGGEIGRDSKTLCGVALERLPRADSSLPYLMRRNATCPTCAAKAERIETMRKGARK